MIFSVTQSPLRDVFRQRQRQRQLTVTEWTNFSVYYLRICTLLRYR